MEKLKFIAPMMPTLVEQPPEAGEWIHEVKYDGYRTQIILEEGAARAFTRNGFEWTTKYALLVNAATQLSVSSAIIDGEVIVTDRESKPDFGALRSAIVTRPERLTFVAFDLLHLEGHDLRGMELEDRRHLLHDLVEPSDGKIQFSHHVTGSGADFYRAADGMGLEGIVSKRPDSVYRSGPTRAWLKIKSYAEEDFEIAGVLRKRGNAPLALMATRDGKRTYVGSAIVALNDSMRERLWKRVKEGAGTAPRGMGKLAAEWTRPGLVGRVRYLRGEERLRHATLRDFREEYSGDGG